ncbi:hypothetical protein GGX14DRAFT_673774 [Mycena pura]|uniref:Uncharacterized protein n=1 Tax=Mycena pura TaxID=153505 RepID=A0AAD6UWF4_9AGAR|nr:hypothetical protein GGX14DRAFT_673774 [Mycena pura]
MPAAWPLDGIHLRRAPHTHPRCLLHATFAIGQSLSFRRRLPPATARAGVTPVKVNEAREMLNDRWRFKQSCQTNHRHCSIWQITSLPTTPPTWSIAQGPSFVGIQGSLGASWPIVAQSSAVGFNLRLPPISEYIVWILEATANGNYRTAIVLAATGAPEFKWRFLDNTSPPPPGGGTGSTGQGTGWLQLIIRVLPLLVAALALQDRALVPGLVLAPQARGRLAALVLARARVTALVLLDRARVAALVPVLLAPQTRERVAMSTANDNTGVAIGAEVQIVGKGGGGRIFWQAGDGSIYIRGWQPDGTSWPTKLLVPGERVRKYVVKTTLSGATVMPDLWDSAHFPSLVKNAKIRLPIRCRPSDPAGIRHPRAPAPRSGPPRRAVGGSAGFAKVCGGSGMTVSRTPLNAVIAIDQIGGPKTEL